MGERTLSVDDLECGPGEKERGGRWGTGIFKYWLLSLVGSRLEGTREQTVSPYSHTASHAFTARPGTCRSPKVVLP